MLVLEYNSLKTNTCKVQHTNPHEIGFANSCKDEVIDPSTVLKISQVQQDNPVLRILAKMEQYFMQMVENTNVFCKNNTLVVPAALHHRADRYSN